MRVASVDLQQAQPAVEEVDVGVDESGRHEATAQVATVGRAPPVGKCPGAYVDEFAVLDHEPSGVDMVRLAGEHVTAYVDGRQRFLSASEVGPRKSRDDHQKSASTPHGCGPLSLVANNGLQCAKL